VPVTFKSNGQRVRHAVKVSMVESLNGAAKAHANFSSLLAPKDKGNLSASCRVDKEATEGDPVAVVKAGGIVVNGVLVDYAEFVELGHHTANGGYVAAQPFFIPGMELARDRFKGDAVKAFGRAFGTHSGELFETLPV